jgi:AcrR family transcriptional regulator
MKDMRESSQKSSPEPKPRGPKRQRGHERVVILTEAAARIFIEKGYDAATMTEIAAEAQSSIGSLYQFFSTKVLLAEALHLDRLQRLNDALVELEQDVDGRSAADIGEAIFDKLGAFIVEFPEFPVLAGRRDIPKERKAHSRAALRERIAGLLGRAKPSVAGEVALLSSIVLELLRIIVAVASDADSGRDEQLVRELRLMMRKRLEEASMRSPSPSLHP